MTRENVMLRQLPQGVPQAATLTAVEDRGLKVELTTADPLTCALGTPLEIVAAETIYLGIAEQWLEGQLFISVEHRLQRKKLEAIQDVWKEPDQG